MTTKKAKTLWLKHMKETEGLDMQYFFLEHILWRRTESKHLANGCAGCVSWNKFKTNEKTKD